MGTYSCVIYSPCGNFTSKGRLVEVNDNTVLLLALCFLCAVVLIIALGLAMKYKMKKDNADHKRRQAQRVQALQMTSGVVPRDA
ncbi:unnamed protein product [Merluccius merluccius]